MSNFDKVIIVVCLILFIPTAYFSYHSEQIQNKAAQIIINGCENIGIEDMGEDDE